MQDASDNDIAWFRQPGPEFRTAAFWFWHRLPTPDETQRQLADMQGKGIGTVMIQARRALAMETYLSPAYLAAYRLAATEAGRLGLRMTIYDEYGWMSGHGGGRTVQDADHLRERHLFWTSGRAMARATELTISNIHSSFLDFLGEAGRRWCYDDGMPDWGDWQVVAAILHPEDSSLSEGNIEILTDAARIERTGPTSCRITIAHGDTGPAGRMLTVFVASRCLSSRLINYLLPEAARRFADTVYAPLLVAAGAVADGFFFDHPYAGFYKWSEHHGNLGNSLLWDGQPVDALQLLALITDVGPGTAALRAGFLENYSRRMHEAFFGTLSRWAKAHGVGFTGHELLTHVGAWGLHAGLSGIDPRSMPGVDYFGIDAFRTVTAVDAADYAPQLSARLGDSVARANGRKRCMIEQYSTGRETGTAGLAGQWGLTAERFRAQAIRHILFGARQIVLHAVNVTDGEDGNGLLSPRFDFPPSFNFEPWWEDCPAIFDELARLSAFLEEGEPLRPVALFYPLETIRVEAAAPDCGVHFGWLAEALARAGIGYDVVNERMLDAVLGGAAPRYATLMLPAVTTLASAATAEIIAAFVRNGGRLLATGPLPHKTRMKGEHPSCAALLTSLAAECGHVVHLPDAGQQDIARLVAAEPRPRPDMRFEDGPSWSSVSRCGDGWRLAAFNDQPTTRQLTIQCAEAAPDFSFWNPQTGKVAVGPRVQHGGRLVLDIGPQKLVCLSIRNAEPRRSFLVDPGSRHSAAAPAVPSPIVLSEGWTLEIGGSGRMAVAVDRGWEVQGYPDFAGTGTYCRRVGLPALAPGLVWLLILPEVHETAELWLDGRFIGRHVAGDARLALPRVCGNVEIELRVRNTGANRYYAGTPYWDGVPKPSGLGRPPYLMAVAEVLVWDQTGGAPL